jgi:chromosome segregation protein
MQEMEARAGRALEELTALKAKPEQLKKERVALTALLATSKQKHAQAITQVKEAEIMLQQADSQQRSDEKQLAEARETQIRQESVGAQAEQSITSIANQISEKLSISPDELSQITKYSEEDELPDLQQLEDRVNRLLRERDSIGPVNLRAEIEMQEISEKLAQFETDKTDLEEAIAKLRRAISELNKEARHRLLDSLTNVNKEFSGLFKTLFGGGSAELKLVNSDDPLTAGLEILASPPGKKLQSLSLLSGGEQALTGLAIIFAVFLTNPSPICILDEVDAPLDDSNVSRFCDLLRHIVSRTETKFLIVTHHRMTMSQMDRLYGVTMAERGISKLVSVDLQTAESLREDA